MRDQPPTEVALLLGAPWQRWLVNATVGAAAVLLGIITGEWIFPALLAWSKSPGPALPRFAVSLDNGGMGLTLWATTVVLAAFNLIAMFLFAVILAPLLRRGGRETSRSRARMGSDILTSGNLRLQTEGARHSAQQEEKKRREEEILQRVFEQNLALRR